MGRVWERTDLSRIAGVCLERNLVIIADEIHCDLVYAGHQHVPIASLGPEVERRTITLMAPSKTFNLPGLKSSIAIIPDATLREKFVASQLDLVRAVNVFGYVATLAAYNEHWTTTRPLRADYRMIARSGAVVWVHDEAYSMVEGNDEFALVKEGTRWTRQSGPLPRPRRTCPGRPTATTDEGRHPVSGPRRFQGRQRFARSSSR